mmetsp:Transcript_145909/g.466249  ORF Transcript_145909/g.466249 Transcript_145909/m.466249 type:complete len:340 (+) Transcript_145909:167-1186(+)
MCTRNRARTTDPHGSQVLQHHIVRLRRQARPRRGIQIESIQRQVVHRLPRDQTPLLEVVPIDMVERPQLDQHVADVGDEVVLPFPRRQLTDLLLHTAARSQHIFPSKRALAPAHVDPVLQGMEELVGAIHAIVPRACAITSCKVKPDGEQSQQKSHHNQKAIGLKIDHDDDEEDQAQGQCINASKPVMRFGVADLRDEQHDADQHQHHDHESEVGSQACADRPRHVVQQRRLATDIDRSINALSAEHRLDGLVRVVLGCAGDRALVDQAMVNPCPIQQRDRLEEVKVAFQGNAFSREHAFWPPRQVHEGEIRQACQVPDRDLACDWTPRGLAQKQRHST